MISSPARADDVNSQNSSRSIDLRSPISQDDQIANDLPSNMKTPTVSKDSVPTPPTKLLPISLRSNSPDHLGSPNVPPNPATPPPISNAEVNSALQDMLSAVTDFARVVRGIAPTTTPDSVPGTPTFTDRPEHPCTGPDELQRLRRQLEESAQRENTLCARVDSLERDLAYIRANLATPQQSRPPPSWSDVVRQPSKPAGPPPARETSSGKKVRYPDTPCPVCHSPSSDGRHHYASACPHRVRKFVPPNTQPAPPSPTNTSPREPQTCHVCKSPDHLSRACPERNSTHTHANPKQDRLPRCAVPTCRQEVPPTMWFAEKQTQFCFANGERIPKPPHYDPTRDSFVCDLCHFNQPKYTRHFTIGKHYPVQVRDRPHNLGDDAEPKPTPPPMPKPAPPPFKHDNKDGDLNITQTVKSEKMQRWLFRQMGEDVDLCPRRKKGWQRNMKRWQHFILLVTKSKGRIIKKQLDKYRIALKSYLSDLAQLAKREKFLQRAHEPEN